MPSVSNKTQPVDRASESEVPIDLAKAQAFQGKAFLDMAGWCSVVMSSLGDRLGLFKDLATHGPATSAEFAGRTRIQERYAREWLSAMTCAGYVTYDPGSRCFSLPPEHAPALAHEDGPLFLGGLIQILSLLPGAVDKLEQVFKMGGGVSQADYDSRVWQAMERETAPTFEHLLPETWLPMMPSLQAALEAGALVADVGCGSGHAMIKLAKAFPNSRFVGYDWYQPQIDRAVANAAAAGVANRVRFERMDATQRLPEQYDIITTFDVVHDVVAPRSLLAAIREILRPDGTFLVMEFNYSDRLEDNVGPIGTFLYSASVLYCTPVSLAHHGEALGAAGLPESKLRELASDAGFRTFYRLPLDDPFHAVYELKP